MICLPCREAADDAVRLGVPVVHDPAICRDAAIQPYGCACEHGVHLQRDLALGELLILDMDVLARINGTLLPASNGTPKETP